MTRGIVADLIGQRFGRLVVLSRAASDRGNNAQWSCECDCGNRAIVRGLSLTTRQRYCSKQCRLYKAELLERDLTGRTFDRLIVLGKSSRKTKAGRSLWRMLCQCGQIVERPSNGIVTGRARSCGCLLQERRGVNSKGKATHGLSSSREYHRDHHRRWAARNPDKVCENARRRHQNVRSHKPKWLTADDREAMRTIYLQARALTKSNGVKHHVDHVVPLMGREVCGLHVPWNLQVVTAEYNNRKSRKLLDEIC